MINKGIPGFLRILNTKPYIKTVLTAFHIGANDITRKPFTTSKKITEEKQKHFLNNIFQKLQEPQKSEPVFEEPKVFQIFIVR